MNIYIDNKEIIYKDYQPLKSLVYENKNIVGAIYNGKIKDLNYRPHNNGKLEWIYRDSEIGQLMEERTLSFLLIAATKSLYPDVSIRIEHTLASCLYCCFDNLVVNEKVIDCIRDKMYEMIQHQEVIYRDIVKTSEAVIFFEEKGLKDKADLLRYRTSQLSSIYELCGIYDYFYGAMYIDLSYIHDFCLRLYEQGVLLGTTPVFQDQPKLFKVFHEYEQWGRKIGISNVAELNQSIIENRYTDLILMSEAMIEKKLAETVQDILSQKNKKKIILIAGPSSAGKTTFSKRLGIHFKLEGIQPLIISMDDFYLNRVDTPRLPDGSYDFENISAIDLKLFNETMNDLLNGKEVQLPYYDFITGERGWYKDKVHLEKNSIIIVEGIHALNEKSSEMIDRTAKYKIYINALTHLNLDHHNRISTSDYRMIRRIVRDYQFRGYSASKTIQIWPSVEAGEQKYIYPYQETADCIFNTSMVYEMSILKKIAVKLLKKIHKDEIGYLEARRLCAMLNYFLDGDETNVPRNSILAEFIGNSVFSDHQN